MYQTTIARTPQQNGRVKRKHGHILNVTRALHFQANVLVKFWGEYILIVGYLINRILSVLLDGKPSFECYMAKQPLIPK